MCITIDAAIDQLLDQGISATERCRAEDWSRTGIALLGEVALHRMDIVEEGWRAAWLISFYDDAPPILQEQAEDRALACFVEESISNRGTELLYAECMYDFRDVFGIARIEDGEFDEGYIPFAESSGYCAGKAG